MAQINVRRGLFRVWLIFACLFVLFVGFVSIGDIREEFEKAALQQAMSKDILLVPAECAKARGTAGSDYVVLKRANLSQLTDEQLRSFKELIEKKAGGAPLTDALCWYDMPKFRANYPEYKDLDDDHLSDALYQKAGIPVTHAPIRPWTRVGHAIGIALGVPLGVLFLGSSFMWAVKGFRA